MAQSDHLASTRQRLRLVLLLAGLLCVSPWQVKAQDDLSRDEARKRLDQTEQELKSSRVKAEDLTKDLVGLAEERARLNSALIEAGKRVQASEAKLSETEGKLAELTEKVLFGEVWARPGLSKRDRSFATVAALIALHRPDQLKGHIWRALDNGVTREELAELFTHLAFYAGWPNGISAAQVAKQVYEERGA